MNTLKCPLCSEALYCENKTWRCKNGHNFDVAKEGYVNLLPVQKKRSKSPGDNKAMLQARRDFLNNGHYQLLSDEINKIANASAELGSLSILDLGCGEGYYLNRIVDSLNAEKLSFAHALDISKDAVRMSAKRKTGAICSVASAYETPYFENVFNFVFSVFSPYSIAELHRVCKPGATALIIGPGKRHLQELASHIYDEVKSHDGNTSQLVAEVPEISSRTTIVVNEQITISNHEIENLLAMTPYYWSISEEKKQKLVALPELTVTLDFEIQILKVA